MMGTERALGSVWMLLGVSEAVTIESLRLAAAMVAALASMYGAYAARQSNKHARRTRAEVRRKRRQARAGDRVIVVDEPDPRKLERPGGGRRRKRRIERPGRRKFDR